MVEEFEDVRETRCVGLPKTNCYHEMETVYKKIYVRHCEETFRRECGVQYVFKPANETVRVCEQRWRRDCETPADDDDDFECSVKQETGMCLECSVECAEGFDLIISCTCSVCHVV